MTDETQASMPSRGRWSYRNSALVSGGCLLEAGMQRRMVPFPLPGRMHLPRPWYSVPDQCPCFQPSTGAKDTARESGRFTAWRDPPFWKAVGRSMEEMEFFEKHLSRGRLAVVAWGLQTNACNSVDRLNTD